MNAKEKVKKEPTLLLALTPVVLTVIILIFSVSVLKVDVQVPLILGTCITAFIAIVFLGYTWQDLEDGAIESLKSIMQAVLLLIIIGATIGTWIVGGVVPALVYYGLQILTPAFFLVACAVLSPLLQAVPGLLWAPSALPLWESQRDWTFLSVWQAVPLYPVPISVIKCLPCPIPRTWLLPLRAQNSQTISNI